jgi:putative FmdB family regulatory protein
MPLYDYRCRACSQVTEVRHGFREAFQGACPSCGSTELARVFHPAGVLFKGSGFYLTDSRKQASDAQAKTSDAKASDSKPDVKSPSPDGSSTAAPAPAASSSDAGSKKSDASAA